MTRPQTPLPEAAHGLHPCAGRMKLQSGQVLSGTLRLVRRIAEGGMGSVWIAEHLVLGTDVAVKVMAHAWAEMPGAPTRFLREARLTARIDSPHVVRVLDCRLTEADEPYLVLELLRGENLEQRVRRRGPLPVDELEIVVRQTCLAIDAAHAAGIIHRDLKPDNVFLVAGATPFVKLLDFGVAKPKDPELWVEADRLPAGTPQYMSPEQLFAPETADERADLFSLAAVAYFALTGRTPFAADSLEGLYFAVDAGEFPRPSTVRPELSPALDAWCARALAHDPAARFPSGVAMADALAEALGSRRAGAGAVEDESAPASGWSLADGASGPVPGLPRRRVVRMLRRGVGSVQRFGAIAAAFALAAGVAWRSAPSMRAAVASPTRSPTSAASVAEGAPSASIGPPRTAPPGRARPRAGAPDGPRGSAQTAGATPSRDAPDPAEVRASIGRILDDMPEGDVAPVADETPALLSGTGEPTIRE